METEELVLDIEELKSAVEESNMDEDVKFGILSILGWFPNLAELWEGYYGSNGG